MMAECIKLEDAIAIIEEKQKELCPIGRYGRNYVYGTDREKYDAWNETIDALENIPSANVVPVMRCKDCAFSQLDGWACDGTAFMPQHQTFPDSFCDHGTRKDEFYES